MAMAPHSLSSTPQVGQFARVVSADPAQSAPVIFCDTVQSLAVHNGVVRISFIRLDADGKPMPALDLLLPQGQAENFVRALNALARPGAASPQSKQA